MTIDEMIEYSKSHISKKARDLLDCINKYGKIEVNANITSKYNSYYFRDKNNNHYFLKWENCADDGNYYLGYVTNNFINYYEVKMAVKLDDYYDIKKVILPDNDNEEITNFYQSNNSKLYSTNDLLYFNLIDKEDIEEYIKSKIRNKPRDLKDKFKDDLTSSILMDLILSKSKKFNAEIYIEDFKNIVLITYYKYGDKKSRILINKE